MILNRLKSLRQKNPDRSVIALMVQILIGAIRIFLARIYLRGCIKGKYVSVNGRPVIGNKGRIILGDEVRIWSNIIRSQLYTDKGGQITVGRNSRLNGVHIDAHMAVIIGANVRIAPYTIILDSDFHDVTDHFSQGKCAPVVIEDNVWIATRATILKGVRIGRNSVVAASAVVTHDVPPNTIVAGVPARVISEIGNNATKPISNRQTLEVKLALSS